MKNPEVRELRKKMTLAVFFLACLSASMLPQLVVPAEEGFLDLYEPWHVNGTLKLDWSVYPWHTVRFWDCPGFIIDTDNALLDLNGHKVMLNLTAMGPGVAGIEIIGKRGVTVKNGTLINFQYGIWTESSSEISLLYNTVTGSGKNGIWIRHSSHVNVSYNYLTGSGDVAIGSDSSNDILIVGNNVSENLREGVYLKDSEQVSVEGNRVSKNGYYGIYMYNSSSNIISGNSISDNPPRGGIYMEKSDYNIISHNTISKNPKGVELRSSNNNSICHNDFINNTKHAESDGINIWDIGYGRATDLGYGGNYWEGYTGTDQYSGVHQNVSGNDGIGDTAHNIDGDDQDRYPLMNPCDTMLCVFDFTWERYAPATDWTNVTCMIAAFSNASITSFNFDKTLKKISFEVVNGTFCKLIIPIDLLDDAFTILVDGVTATSVLLWDGTHHFIDFTFNNSTHGIEVKAETAIRILGDLNDDGEVNIIDITIAAKNFGMKNKK
jgi:parallel beta-helix repeat protein